MTLLLKLLCGTDVGGDKYGVEGSSRAEEMYLSSV